MASKRELFFVRCILLDQFLQPSLHSLCDMGFNVQSFEQLLRRCHLLGAAPGMLVCAVHEPRSESFICSRQFRYNIAPQPIFMPGRTRGVQGFYECPGQAFNEHAAQQFALGGISRRIRNLFHRHSKWSQYINDAICTLARRERGSR